MVGTIVGLAFVAAVVTLTFIGVVPPLLVVAVASLPFLYLLGAQPVLRRLAARNAVRRPRETLLVILGALLGTAIITGSFVVGDTLRSSIRRSAYTQLGPVDELVALPSPAAQSATAAALSARLPAAAKDGVLPVTGTAVAVSTVGPAPRAEPSAALWELDFAAGRQFGGQSAATGLSGPTPGPGEAVLGRDLATTLRVRPGDAVRVYAYGGGVDLRVVRILPRLGLAGLWLGRGSAAPTVFVAPGTLAHLQAAGGAGAAAGGAGAAAGGAAPPDFLVAVSNAGGVIQTRANSDAQAARIASVLGAASTSTVSTVKADRLESAAAAGKQFTTLFTGIGFFSVLAGVLLLVNIFVMLAQERKSELGMLRAMGLRRSGLLGAFSLEGWLYALASSAVGMLAGIGVGRVIVSVASGVFSSGRTKLDLHFAATLHSIEAGFAIGFSIALLTVIGASLGIARVNVIRAIRDLPEPGDTHRHPGVGMLGWVLAGAGGSLTINGLQRDTGLQILVGPVLLALGVVLILGRSLPRRPVVTVAALVALAWGVGAFDAVPRAFANTGIAVFIVQGIILTGAAVALVTQNQDVIGAAIRKVGGGSRNMSLRLGLAYPLARKLRTALILVSYSLVVFTLAFITVFSSLFAGQVNSLTRKVSGGFSLAVTSNPSQPVPASALAGRTGVSAVAAFASTDAQFTSAGVADKPVPWPVASFDATFVRVGPPTLAHRSVAYPDDRSAYQALVDHPDLTIVPGGFLGGGRRGPGAKDVEVGDTVTLIDPQSGATRALQVIGVGQDTAVVDSALVAPSVMQSMFGDRAAPTTLLVATAPGVDAQAMADRINGDYVASGADAASFRSSINDDLSSTQQFFRLMQGYLALGLIVGIAGLGVVMIRAVRERRRQIGVLRALGFSGIAVRRAFVAESSFVAAEGVLIGTGLAVITAWRLVSNSSFGQGLQFSVPWLQLALLVGGTFVVSLLVTAAPAQQASRIRPAVALRLAD